jgi:hypothetical protein
MRMLRWLKLYILPSLMLVFVGFFLAFKMWAIALIFAISLLAVMSPGKEEYPFFGEKRPGWLVWVHENVRESSRLAISSLVSGIGLLIVALTLGFSIGVGVGIAMAFIIHTLWLVRLVTREQGA